MTLTLTLRERPAVPLEAEGVTPDRVSALSRGEIEALTVWEGNRRAQVGDFFDVSRATGTGSCASRATSRASSSSARA